MKPLCDAMLHKKLRGRTFARPTFAAWRTVARVLDVVPLNRAEHAHYRELTGRDSATREAFREAYLIKPRPSRRDAVSRSLCASSTSRRRSCELFRACPSRGHHLSPGGASAVRARAAARGLAPGRAGLPSARPTSSTRGGPLHLVRERVPSPLPAPSSHSTGARRRERAP